MHKYGVKFRFEKSIGRQSTVLLKAGLINSEVRPRSFFVKLWISPGMGTPSLPSVQHPPGKKMVFLTVSSNFPLLKFVAVCFSSSCCAGPSRVWLPSSLQPPIRELTAAIDQALQSPHCLDSLQIIGIFHVQDSELQLQPHQCWEERKNHMPQSRPGCNLLSGWPTQCASQQDPHHPFCIGTTLDYQPRAHNVEWGPTISNGRFYVYSHWGLPWAPDCWDEAAWQYWPPCLDTVSSDSGCSHPSMLHSAKTGTNVQSFGWWKWDPPHFSHWLHMSLQHMVTVDQPLLQRKRTGTFLHNNATFLTRNAWWSLFLSRTGEVGKWGSRDMSQVNIFSPITATFTMLSTINVSTFFYYYLCILTSKRFL